MSKSSKKTKAERASDLLSFYTVGELAESMNVTRQTVRRWVRGESQPNKENFKKVQRREYYYKVERPETIKSSRGLEGRGVLDENAEVIALIRELEMGSDRLNKIAGADKADFSIRTIKNGEVRTFTETFFNKGKAEVDPEELISFLWRAFRNQEDRFGGSDVAVMLDGITI